MGLASRLFRIQPGEGRLVALVVGLATLSMTAFAIGESGVDALFFDRVGAQALPQTYLLQGAVAFAVMLALTGILGRLGHRRAYLLAPLALGVAVLVGRVLILTNGRWVFVALWVTAAVGTLLIGVSLWGVAGSVVDTRQAKRLFPLFAGGGILGSVIGGLLTKPLAQLIGAENLLLVWSGGLAASTVLSRMALGPRSARATRRAARRPPSAFRDIRASFAFVRRSRLLTWMTVAAVFFSILFYLMYLPYAQAASARFPKADELAGFFGLFWAGVTLAAFLTSMLATNRLFAWLGVAAMVIVLPVLYTAAFGVLLVASGFLTLVALRFVLGTWLQGVASPGWETLTNVIPESKRDQARAFLNGGPTQIGTIAAGVIALVGQRTLTVRQFAMVGLAAAIVTVIATVGIRRSYAGALADALRTGRPHVFESGPVRQPSVAATLDADAARALDRAMRSADVRERRVAFQLAAGMPGTSPDATLEGLRDDDPVVRLSAVRAWDVSAGAGQDAAAALIDDPDPSVSAAAAARALDRDAGHGESRLRRLLGDTDAGIRAAALRQLDLAPPAWQARLATEHISDPEPEVRAVALERLADAAPDTVATAAAAGLRDPDPAVRIAAGRALGSAEPTPIGLILESLDDRRTADAGVEAVRHAVLDGGREGVRRFVVSAGDRATRDRELAGRIHPTDEPTALLRDAILDRGRTTARAGLWAATLLGHRREAMETAIENLDGTSSQVATALETLETAGDPPLVRPLLTLWEPMVASTRRPDDGLSAALQDEDAFVRQCAEFVQAYAREDSMAGTVGGLSIIERVLFLRKVPIFADLAATDLDHVARIAEERGYADGDVIAAEGEMGDELFIVVEGTIRVIQGEPGSERELVRRSVGDVVGEMSLIAQAPRIASLIADGPVRAIRLGRHEFESMLRERPSVGLAVMRVLVQRLAERTSPEGA